MLLLTPFQGYLNNINLFATILSESNRAGFFGPIASCIYPMQRFARWDSCG